MRTCKTNTIENAVACHVIIECMKWALSHNGNGNVSYHPDVVEDVQHEINELERIANETELEKEDQEVLDMVHPCRYDLICDHASNSIFTAIDAAWMNAIKVFEDFLL
jgi:hypothetical protein